MRSVEHSNFRKQNYRHVTSFSLGDFRAQRFEQSLNVAPLDVSARRVLEDEFKSALMLALHGTMVLLISTIYKHRPSTIGQADCPSAEKI